MHQQEENSIHQSWQSHAERRRRREFHLFLSLLVELLPLMHRKWWKTCYHHLAWSSAPLTGKSANNYVMGSTIPSWSITPLFNSSWMYWSILVRRYLKRWMLFFAICPRVRAGWHNRRTRRTLGLDLNYMSAFVDVLSVVMSRRLHGHVFDLRCISRHVWGAVGQR